MEIIKCANGDEAARKATESINEALSELRAGVPTLFLFSGGTSFNLLHGIDIRFLGPHLTIVALDERFSEDSLVNHFLKISHSLFYHHALELGVNFIDTSVQRSETLEELTARYEAAIFDWAKNNEGGKIIATMGIGYDGHVAGIMPFPENPQTFTKLFENPEHWITGYDAGLAKTEHPLRVTSNITFLRNFVDFAVVYVTGEKKIAALTKSTGEKGSLAETPGRILREMKQVRIFTDI